MRALKLIIAREYSSRIKKKSFIIMTVVMPFLFLALIFVPLILSGIKDSESKRIVVVDQTNKYANHLESFDNYIFEITTDNSNINKEQIGSEIFGILQVTDNLSENPNSVTFFSEKQAPMDLLSYINNTFSEIVKTDKINNLALQEGVSPDAVIAIRQVMDSSNNVKVSTMRISNDGSEKETSTGIASAIGTVFTFLMYMFILMYGTMVMQGVVEEKSNRIVEVMISSVRPFDLMMGKIIGIGLTGLTQLGIWFAIVGVALGVKGILFSDFDVSSMHRLLSQADLMSSINWGEIIIYFLLLFIGGYLIYASLFAMFGAAVDSAQDTQQFVMPVTIIFLFAFYAGMYSIQNPDGPLAFWCSMIPLTSPIVMMVRIPFEIPLWEKLLSLAILYTSIFFVVRFSAKIYRVGILMYGKKPSIKEILKWISYK